MTSKQKYPKIIKNVRCIEVNKQEHIFEAPDIGQADHLKHFILTGWNRPSNIKTGDLGTMVYKITPNHALWWFEKHC